MTDRALSSTQQTPAALPTVRRVDLRDVGGALVLGIADFRANPLHSMFLALVYPAVGLLLGWLAARAGTVPLLYPIAAGLALMGPLAGVGVYELSRRRALGLEPSWLAELAVFRSSRIGPVVQLGVLLAVIFVLWLVTANALYDHTLRGVGRDSIAELFTSVLTTHAGWVLCVAGTGAGFLFAISALGLGVISFPLLLDRHLEGGTEERTAAAVEISVRAVIANPMPMAAWGLIVVSGLLLGLLTAAVGLVVIMPILGHATWHLYRKVVV